MNQHNDDYILKTASKVKRMHHKTKCTLFFVAFNSMSLEPIRLI